MHLQIICSKILHDTQVKETGQQFVAMLLLPFLNIGVILALSHSDDGSSSVGGEKTLH